MKFRFESIALLFQEKKFKIDFQHGCYGDHLVFPIRIILAIFDLQVTPILFVKFRVKGPCYSEEEFQECNCGGHFLFPIGTIFAIFLYPQVTLMLSTKIFVS